MTTAYICDFQPTPIGKFGGALASVRPDDLAAHVIRALLARNTRLDANGIDEVYMGCAN
jgi:acetyl-CoA acyltransferase